MAQVSINFNSDYLRDELVIENVGGSVSTFKGGPYLATQQGSFRVALTEDEDMDAIINALTRHKKGREVVRLQQAVDRAEGFHRASLERKDRAYEAYIKADEVCNVAYQAVVDAKAALDRAVGR